MTLSAALAYLHDRPPGTTLHIRAALADGVNLAKLCAERHLSYWINGRTLTLKNRARPTPSVAPHGTRVN